MYIAASSGISACRGFYFYYKYYLNSHISWEGVEQRNIPEKLPDIHKEQIDSSNKFIYYQNVCTWSYSFAWWTWKDWRKHIDWMAISGISLSLAPVQEEIWSRIYTKIGLTQEEIDDHFAGPAFLAWQRMGNIRGWAGPLTQTFKSNSLVLMKRIIKSIRKLGGFVALPAFAGHVPTAFNRIFPNITFSVVDCWNKFSKEFCCPLYIDPTDQLFKNISKIFLKEVVKEYGTDHIYFADPFNEVQPKLAQPDYLRETANGIYSSMKEVDENAVWLLQGWMLVKNPFWSEELMEAFFTAIPPGRMLVIDLQSEQHPQYSRTKSFYGQPFIWSMLQNFGGTLGMLGSVNILNSRPFDALQMENSTMIGFGITTEGIFQNYAMYEFALEVGWNLTKPLTQEEIQNWFNFYAFTRYGKKSSSINIAWKYLIKSVYSFEGLEMMRGKYVINRRPSLKIEPWVWYEPALVKNAWKKIIKNKKLIKSSHLLRHDLVDVTRQNLQLIGDSIYLEIKKAYQEKNLSLFAVQKKLMIELFDDLEILLKSSSNFLLGKWLNSAKKMGSTPAEIKLFEFNARNQITLWGPRGEIVDYANKQWSGIVLDVFKPRWEIFLNELEHCLKSGAKFDENLVRKRMFSLVEEPFVVDDKIYSVVGEGT